MVSNPQEERLRHLDSAPLIRPEAAAFRAPVRPSFPDLSLSHAAQLPPSPPVPLRASGAAGSLGRRVSMAAGASVPQALSAPWLRREVRPGCGRSLGNGGPGLAGRAGYGGGVLPAGSGCRLHPHVGAVRRRGAGQVPPWSEAVVWSAGFEGARAAAPDGDPTRRLASAVVAAPFQVLSKLDPRLRFYSVALWRRQAKRRCQFCIYLFLKQGSTLHGLILWAMLA